MNSELVAGDVPTSNWMGIKPWGKVGAKGALKHLPRYDGTNPIDARMDPSRSATPSLVQFDAASHLSKGLKNSN